MPNQMIFKRYELKYILTRAQQKSLLSVMQFHMHQDTFAHTLIRNIYYDTDSFLLARRSIEKPVYIRSCSCPMKEMPLLHWMTVIFALPLIITSLPDATHSA